MSSEWRSPTFIARYWSRVQLGASSDCWGWSGSLVAGYGQIEDRWGGERTRWPAHRVAVLLR